MGRYLGPKVKITKREGINLFLKTNKKNLNFEKNKYKIKKSDFNYQLREKQKVKYMYGILENQFYNYYKKSLKIKGNTGKNLLKLLESRLDNVIYRMGFGVTRSESRQLVKHKIIKVNGKTVNIPSYNVNPNDEIKIRSKFKSQIRIKKSLNLFCFKKKLNWIKVDIKKMKGIFKRLPKRSELYSNINEHLIIEYYSK